MKCAACGRVNRAEAGFCAWCGLPIIAKEDKGAPPALEVAKPPAPVAAEGSSAPLLPAEAAAPANQTQEVPPAGAAVPAPLLAAQPADGKPASAPAGTLAIGARLAARYEITEILESTAERTTYRVRDWQRCPACGHTDNPAGSDFCRECGAALDKPSYATIVEQVRPAPERYDVHFVEAERDYFVTADPLSSADKEPKVQGPTTQVPLRLVWAKATDQGLQRDHNEDYLEAWHFARSSGGTLGLFVVADGLGGQDSGEVASRMATEAIWQTLRPGVWEPVLRGESLAADALEQQLIAAISAANQSVYDARVARNSQMSSTLTMALLVDNMAYIGNVGDSRTYLWNELGLRAITKDHSLVQRLVDTGQLQPEEVYTHPQRNLIYQSIGDRPEVKPDVFRHPLAPADQLLLCSDGLWEMVRSEGIEEVLLSEPDAQRACARLVRDSNLAGGEDNISVIIVQVTTA
jgi:serine/threonine protein phosphatase PrpC